MVGLHRIHDCVRLPALRQNRRPRLRVRKVGIRNRLADVVEKPRALCNNWVAIYFGGNHTRNLGGLNGVLERVLIERIVEVQPPQQNQKLGRDAHKPQRFHGLSSVRDSFALDFPTGFGNLLLDCRRIYSAVGDELFERDFRDLAPHGIEGGDEDKIGSLVDDERRARFGLERADIAPLFANQPALHRLVGNFDHRDRRRLRELCRKPLHRLHQNPLRRVVDFALGLFENFGFVERKVFDALFLDFLFRLLAQFFDVQIRNSRELYGVAFGGFPVFLARGAVSGVFGFGALVGALCCGNAVFDLGELFLLLALRRLAHREQVLVFAFQLDFARLV